MGYTGDKKREYQRNWMRARRDKAIEYLGDKCAKCGSTDRLEIDHIDSKLKTMNPAAIWSRTEAVREKELANCQVLCYSCHKAKTKSEVWINHPHGSRYRYDKGCKCAACRRSKAEYMQKWRKIKRV